MPAKREWVVEANEYGEIDSDELSHLMLRVGTVLEMVGGTVAIGSRRQEVAEVDADGEPTGETFWVTERIVAQWDSFAPGRRLPRVEGEPLPESDDELPITGEPPEFIEEDPDAMRERDEETVAAELEAEDELEPTEA